MTFQGQTNLIKNISKEEMDSYYSFFEERARASGFCQVKYLALGNIIVKIENHVPDLAQHIETEFAYCLSDTADAYDKTFYIWNDDVSSYVANSANKLAPLFIFSQNLDKPAISIYSAENKLSAYNSETKTYYFAQNEKFSIDIIRKMGHLFAVQINAMMKDSDMALVHAAAVGIDDKGVLICARGEGGKSTLSISAMLEGFQYVSDDYLILSKTDQLYAHPIYSFTNIFPQTQAKMVGLKSKLMWDSYWRPQKQTLDISAHHDSFVKKLPIKAVIFPRIADVEIPFIEPVEKGKAIAQMIHSTIHQLGDYDNAGHIKKLIALTSDLEAYQINLSPDLEANVKILRNFIYEQL